MPQIPTPMSSVIEIGQGFPDELRSKAAALYDVSFGAKVSIAIPDATKRLAILAEAFNPEYCFIAMSGSELVGIAGFKNSSGALTGGMTFALLRKHLGLARAVRAISVLALFTAAFANAVRAGASKAIKAELFDPHDAAHAGELIGGALGNCSSALPSACW